MTVEDKMNIDERRKYLRMMQKRYRGASRGEKSKLLDEMEAVTGQHRKGLIRQMRGELERKPRRRQRGPEYGGDVAYVIRVIAESLDWVCAERLTPNLVWMAKHLSAHGEVEVTEEVMAKLGSISISTVQRLLSRQPRLHSRLPRRGPERANRLTRSIPAGRIAWDEAKPGHFEVDLVHHCGPSASGLYVHTLQMVDVATGWSERVAVLGRSYRVVADGFQRILARLPFPVLEIHSDNGSEFLNDHLVRFWQDRLHGVHLSRSRAWRKNDNRFVEQKNDTLVRAYLGYDRLDTVEQTRRLNQLYDQMGLYYNLFQPVLRLQEKALLPPEPGHPPRLRRRFDHARTPLDRLLASGVLDPAQLALLQALRHTTNPRLLRQHIHLSRDHLLALPSATSDCPQNVFLTLFTHLISWKEVPMRLPLR